MYTQIYIGTYLLYMLTVNLIKVKQGIHILKKQDLSSDTEAPFFFVHSVSDICINMQHI